MANTLQASADYGEITIDSLLQNEEPALSESNLQTLSIEESDVQEVNTEKEIDTDEEANNVVTEGQVKTYEPTDEKGIEIVESKEEVIKEESSPDETPVQIEKDFTEEEPMEVATIEIPSVESVEGE
jgi:hypothetical protein